MALMGSKELIGLDIGSSAIKLAHVKPVGVEFRVRKFGVFPLPADAIVDGAIMDHVSVIEGIKTALRELNVKEKEVATSLSGHSVIIKKVVLPTTTPEELEESIQWEVEQYIPFDIKDVKIDFQVIGPLKEDPSKMDVLLVAVKTDLVNDYVSVIKDAGLTPTIVDIDSIAAGNAFELCRPVSDEQVPMVVNVGASFMNINILHSGVPLFTRDVPMGGGMYTSEIQKQLAVSFETAEELKVGKKDAGDRAEKIREIMRTVSNILSTEVQRSYNFFSATYPDRLVTKVYLTGGAARRGAVRPVRGAHTGGRFGGPVHGVRVQHRRHGCRRACAAEPGGSEMIRINLIRGKRKKKKEFNVDALYLLLPLLVIVGVLLFHRSVSGTIENLNTDIRRANAEVARLKKEIGEVENFKARKAELQQKVDVISSLQTGRTGPVNIFEALSASIPEKCWIDSLSLRGDKVQISGIALNNYTIANFMTALGQSGRFRNVVLGSADKTTVSNVKLVRFGLTFNAVRNEGK
jgi:type IV pilus assembly protein PilM